MEVNATDIEWTIDAATVVSIGSSVVILLSGAVAVVCLILYMKRSEQQIQRFRPPIAVCVKCGTTLQIQQQKRSIGVSTTPDDTRRQSEVAPESALYAISGADLEKADLRVICGRITDSEQTFSTSAANSRCLPHSQCSEDVVYELSRRKLSFESLDVYESVSERETPTDPGIRQFTGSPPKPNERRQGVVQHIAGEAFGALPRYRSRQPSWKLSSSSQTLKCVNHMTLFDVSDDSEDDTRDDRTPQSIDC